MCRIDAHPAGRAGRSRRWAEAARSVLHIRCAIAAAQIGPPSQECLPHIGLRTTSERAKVPGV